MTQSGIYDDDSTARQLGDKVKALSLDYRWSVGLRKLAGTGGQGKRAARLFGAAEAMRKALYGPLLPAEVEDYEGIKAAVRTLLDEASWEAAFAEGRAMTPEETIEYALSEKPAPLASAGAVPPSTDEPAGLTPREREVVKLVAQGLTNRQIASELFISERTVATHLGRVFKKLEVHSREQVAELFEEPSQAQDSA